MELKTEKTDRRSEPEMDIFPHDQTDIVIYDLDKIDKIYKDMGLRDTWVENIYCQQHNPKKPKGDYSNQVHFVWNKYKRKMIPIKGVYYIDDDIAKRYNNEYLQAAIQGYKFI